MISTREGTSELFVHINTILSGARFNFSIPSPLPFLYFSLAMPALRLWSLGIFLFFSGLLRAEPVSVEASIESNSGLENSPLEGIVTITHDKQERVDLDSFKMEGKALKVHFIQDVDMTSGSGSAVVSFYRFTLPAKAKGLHVLPSLSIQVGKQTYQTIPSTYEVRSQDSHSLTPHILPQQPVSHPKKFKKAATQGRPFSSSSSTNPLVFRLEAWVQGPTHLYPGQRTQLVYRISYNRSIDLVESNLPFVHPQHFKKIGDVHILDSQQQELTIQDISQEIEASQPGTFRFGSSKIAGYAYQLNSLGQKVYDKQLLQAQAPAVEIVVSPFPSTRRPPSFNGALGQIQAELKMLTPKTIKLGEKIKLQMTLSGITNLADLHLPDLHCQPGFSGFFQLSDLPPSGEITEDSKVFSIEMIPTSNFAHAIPSIEVSSFDPDTHNYFVQQTTPIPLTLQAPPLTLSPVMRIPPLATSSQTASPILWNPSAWPLPPLEIEGQLVSPNSLYLPWIQTNWVFLLLPLIAGLLLMQMRWRNYWLQHPKLIKRKSEDILKEALKAKSTPSTQVLHLLEEAYWWKLWEEGWIPPFQANLDALPQQGIGGEVRAFIFHLQSLRYSPQQTYTLSALQEQAQDLFHRLRSPPASIFPKGKE